VDIMKCTYITQMVWPMPHLSCMLCVNGYGLLLRRPLCTTMKAESGTRQNDALQRPSEQVMCEAAVVEVCSKITIKSIVST
jgi:hypothetical protein